MMAVNEKASEIEGKSNETEPTTDKENVETYGGMKLFLYRQKFSKPSLVFCGLLLSRTDIFVIFLCWQIAVSYFLKSLTLMPTWAVAYRRKNTFSLFESTINLRPTFIERSYDFPAA